MKIKHKIILTAVITAIATTAVLGAVGYAVIYKTTSLDKFEKKISMINRYLEDDYIYEYDEDKMLEQAVAGYVEGLDEKYTYYYNPEELKS